MSENNIKLYIIKERGSAPPRQVTKVIETLWKIKIRQQKILNVKHKVPISRPCNQISTKEILN